MNSSSHLTQSGQTNGHVTQPLTQQEQVILHFIAAGFSRKEIAAQLVVSLNTIKTHTQNLYGKLKAHSRKQAICQAQQLGLLSNTSISLNGNGHYPKLIFSDRFKLK